jgi:hypothetical protein
MGVVAQALSAIASALRMRDDPEPARTRPNPDEPPVLLVKAKVHDVLRRGVPVNRIVPGPSFHTARAIFADGSVAVVRSIPEGHLMSAAVACLRTRVTARPAVKDSEGDVVFTWRGGQVLVELMGPDQPD